MCSLMSSDACVRGCSTPSLGRIVRSLSSAWHAGARRPRRSEGPIAPLSPTASCAGDYEDREHASESMYAGTYAVRRQAMVDALAQDQTRHDVREPCNAQGVVFLLEHYRTFHAFVAQ